MGGTLHDIFQSHIEFEEMTTRISAMTKWDRAKIMGTLLVFEHVTGVKGTSAAKMLGNLLAAGADFSRFYDPPKSSHPKTGYKKPKNPA